MAWFNLPVHPKFENKGADKFLSTPINPAEECWIGVNGQVHLANVFCGTLFEQGGEVWIESPSKEVTVPIGKVSLFSNEPREGLIGKSALYQNICELAGFKVKILVADSYDSAFNREHNLQPGGVKYVVPNESN
jgi:hypothetical protein